MAASMDAGSVLALAPSPSQSFLLTSNDVQRDMEELTRSMASIDTNDEGVSNGRSAAEQIWNRRTSEPTSISDPNEEDDPFDRYMANPPAAPSSDSSSSAALRSPTDVGSSSHYTTTVRSSEQDDAEDDDFPRGRPGLPEMRYGWHRHLGWHKHWARQHVTETVEDYGAHHQIVKDPVILPAESSSPRQIRGSTRLVSDIEVASDTTDNTENTSLEAFEPTRNVVNLHTARRKSAASGGIPPSPRSRSAASAAGATRTMVRAALEPTGAPVGLPGPSTSASCPQSSHWSAPSSALRLVGAANAFLGTVPIELEQPLDKQGPIVHPEDALFFDEVNGLHDSLSLSHKPKGKGRLSGAAARAAAPHAPVHFAERISMYKVAVKKHEHEVQDRLRSGAGTSASNGGGRSSTSPQQQRPRRQSSTSKLPVPAAAPIEAAAAKVASPKPEKRRSKLQEMWGDELEKLRD